MSDDRNVYIAIMRAADLGKGILLSAEEVRCLSLDDAIETVASNSLTENEQFTVAYHGWRKISPLSRPTNEPPGEVP